MFDKACFLRHHLHYQRHSSGRRQFHRLRLRTEESGFWVTGSPKTKWMTRLIFSFSSVFFVNFFFETSSSLAVQRLKWNSPSVSFSKLQRLFWQTESVMRVAPYPLIQVILTVIKLLRLCLPHELHVDLRVKLPTLGQLQLKHTHTNIQKAPISTSHIPSTHT